MQPPANVLNAVHMRTPFPVVTRWLKGRWAHWMLAALVSGCQPGSPDLTADFPARLGYAVNADGSFTNDCGDRVTASVRTVEWGPGGDSVVAVIPAGSNMPACYGDGPGLVTIWSTDKTQRQPWITHRGYVSLLPGSGKGTAQAALGGPGQSFPVMQWNGSAFESAGRAADEREFGTGLVLP